MEAIVNRVQKYIDYIRPKADAYIAMDICTKNKEDLEGLRKYVAVPYKEGLHGHEYENIRPLDIYDVENFEQYLTDKAKKVYLRKTDNTVYEYLEYTCKFLKAWKIQLFGFSHYTFFNDERKLKYYFQKVLFKHLPFKREQKAKLVRYISLEAKVNAEYNIEYYTKKLAKLFNYLVTKNILCYATLNKVMLVQIHKSDIICFNLWAVSNIEASNSAIINKQIGLNVFSDEGESIVNFDWKIIDDLK